MIMSCGAIPGYGDRPRKKINAVCSSFMTHSDHNTPAVVEVVVGIEDLPRVMTSHRSIPNDHLHSKGIRSGSVLDLKVCT